MKTDEIALKFKRICELKKKISLLQESRSAEEQALTIVYKVDECNRARTTLALNYQDKINGLIGQIRDIEAELGSEDN